MRPGAAPLWSLADGILRSLRPQQIGPDRELPAAEVARLRVLIDTSEDGLGVVMREFGLGQNHNLLLLVDQFEEVFRYRSDEEEEERSRFIELLLAVARDRPPGIYIVTTMRSEYLGYCARFAELAETLNETHYLVPRMTVQELRQAIVEPARMKNGRIAPDLVERLIADITSQEDQLPILQHTLLWMWTQEEERKRLDPSGDAAIELDLEHYLQLDAGKNRWTPNALSRHGDRILEGLTPEERRVAEIMIRRLVEAAESRNRLRRPTRCGTVAKLADAPLATVQKVIDAFRAEDASFIYVSRQVVADDTSIDIMHESLIRQWATLDGWVRRERACYEVYNDLCRAAQRRRNGQGGLLEGLELARARQWLWHEEPTRLWARRYGGDFNGALTYLEESEEADDNARRAAEESEWKARESEQQALRSKLEQQTKLAHLTRFATGAALIAIMLAGVAGTGFWRANELVTETKAATFWHRLKLFGDPLDGDAVTALWELTRQDEKVRVSFVRQLAQRPELLQQFGFKPQPIARAVGLRWPPTAQQTGEEIVAQVASDAFKPDQRNMFALVTYTRAVAVLAPRLDDTLAQDAIGKITAAINELAGQDQLSERELWALAEMVGVFSDRIGTAAIEPARARLLREITAPAPSEGSDRRARAVGRAIEVTVDDLTPAQRVEATRSIGARLAQNIDAWNATSIPHTLTALLPVVDGRDQPDLLSGLPPAIAASAVARADAETPTCWR